MPVAHLLTGGLRRQPAVPAVAGAEVGAVLGATEELDRPASRLEAEVATFVLR